MERRGKRRKEAEKSRNSESGRSCEANRGAIVGAIDGEKNRTKRDVQFDRLSLSSRIFFHGHSRDTDGEIWESRFCRNEEAFRLGRKYNGTFWRIANVPAEIERNLSFRWYLCNDVLRCITTYYEMTDYAWCFLWQSTSLMWTLNVPLTFRLMG